VRSLSGSAEHDIDNSVIRRYIKSERIRQAIALGGGTALGQIAVILATPIWSRIYDPSDFGLYGLILSFLSTAVVAASLRYDMAIPMARNNDEGLRLLLLALFCTIPVSIFSGVVFLLLVLRRLWGFGAVEAWSAMFVVVSVMLTSMFSALRYWHVRNSNFGGISTALIAQGAGRALTPILLTPLKWGWVALLSGEIVGRSLGIRRLASSVLPQLSSIAHRTTRKDLVDLLKAFRQYPLVFLPSSVLDAASGAIVVPVIVALYGVSAGGQFLLAQQVVMAPSAFICASLGDVFHAQLVPSTRGKTGDLAKLIWRTAVRLLLFAATIYLPIALLAPFVAVPIFGRSWSNVGQFVVILAPATVITIAVNPISRAMLVSRIPQTKLIADAAKLALPVLGLLAGFHYANGSITASLILYSLMVSISYLIYFAIILYSVSVKNQLPMESAHPNPPFQSSDV
jgi:O-antigen/teichoic acid export membrane protein